MADERLPYIQVQCECERMHLLIQHLFRSSILKTGIKEIFIVDLLQQFSMTPIKPTVIIRVNGRSDIGYVCQVLRDLGYTDVDVDLR